jgi:hypothetical protein
LIPNRIYGFTSKAKTILRVLPVEVSISQAFNPKKTTIKPPHKKYFAIWDTGATNSVITEKVVQECLLKPIGMTEVHHVGGKGFREVFLVNVVLPNSVGISALRVTQGDIVGQAEVLIGMDIISRGDFTISNFNGTTWFSFRIPSVRHIDLKEDPTTKAKYVKDSQLEKKLAVMILAPAVAAINIRSVAENNSRCANPAFSPKMNSFGYLKQFSIYRNLEKPIAKSI